MAVQLAPHGAWESPITVEHVAGGDGRPSHLGLVGEEVWWTEPRPSEDGRRTLMRRSEDGSVASVLPAPWNVRNRVHEYGGTPWVGCMGEAGPLIVFSNFADQRLYVFEPDGGREPRPITPVPRFPSGLRWCDMEFFTRRGEVWAVLEEFTGERSTQLRRVLAAVPLDGSAADDRGAVRELTDDAYRFTTGPRLNADQTRAAWIAWNHPDMPWDATELRIAEITSDGAFANTRTLAGGDEESLPQAEWAPGLAAAGAKVYGLAASPSSGYEVVEYDVDGDRFRTVAAPHVDEVDPAYYPEPERRVFAGPGGREVHADVYPPRNPDFAAPEGELPPYVVWVHGGPTGHVRAVLDLELAYFTSRGIGVVQVNYGGSTGYGREYRNRLREQWGVVDVEDCAAVARALAEEGTADRARLAIRGGSAGGWTAAASLVSPAARGLYACAAIAYPILDLSAWLGDDTHDFESQYLHTLVGPADAVPGRYRDRSPVNHADLIAAPFLLLQGLEDAICPPAQSERLLERVAGRGVPHAYLAYEGEQHGFRKQSTIVSALLAEHALYAQVFGFAAPSGADSELRT